MVRINCLNVTLALVAVYTSYIVYIYFIQHQPNAELLAAIKSKSTPHFQHILVTTLTTLSHSTTSSLPTVHSLHFGNGRSVSAAIAMHGTADMLQYWHELGGDITTASSTDGRTPLHIAATFNTAHFVDHLLSLLPPSAVHVRADNSYTALLYAVLFSQHNNTRTLLQYGADANDRLAIGGRFSASQLAAIYSDGSMMDALVEAGGVVEPTESYYDDWLRGWERVQLRRGQQDGQQVHTVDEAVWVGDEVSRTDNRQRWTEKVGIAQAEEASYTVFDS